MIREVINESVDLGAIERVDRTGGGIVIRGVKLAGLISRNRRRYKPAALIGATGLYEGAHVFVNHSKGPRGYEERIASVFNAHYDSSKQGMFGDLDVNPKHPAAESVAHDAEQATRGIGLSHNVVCETSQQGGETVIESIVKVNSVDLVAGPATADSLFEQYMAEQHEVDPADESHNENSRHGWRPSPASHFQRIASGGRSNQQRQLANESISIGERNMVVKRSLSERLTGIASGPRIGHSVAFEGECMGDAPMPIDGELAGDATQNAVDDELIQHLRTKVRSLDALSPEEKRELLKLLGDVADAAAIEQVEEAIDAATFVPTTADKYRRWAARR